MSIEFSIDEILEMAQVIETNGGEFYRKAAEMHENARELLLKLAIMEDQHDAFFANMRKALTDREKEVVTYDPNNEGAAYLAALAESRDLVVDKKPSDALSGNESVTDIIDIAIQFEKDTIIFFTAMKDLVPGSTGGAKMDAIIHEEVAHINWLAKQRILSA
jgi:rubrerythrin